MEPIKESIEKQKDNSAYSKNGGARPGAGRPKGGENKATKEKRIVKEEMKQRIMRSKDSLLNSQMNLAQGVQMLFKSKKLTIEDKEGNVIEIRKEKPILVENQEEIESYLAGEYDDDKDNYYFITIEKPDNKAIDSMFDRAFDKARQNVGLDGGEEGKPIPIEMKVKANQSIKEFLNGNSEDITKRQQGDDKSSIPVQSEEH